MAMLIAVPLREKHTSLGARRKFRVVVVVNHHPRNFRNRWPSSAVWSMSTPTLAEGVILVCAVCRELGRVRWSFNATPLVPQF